MNYNQLINMFMRLFMRKIMNRGIDAGIDLVSKRGRGRAGGEETDLTPEERKRAGHAKQTARKARQGAKLVRRIGRF